MEHCRCKGFVFVLCGDNTEGIRSDGDDTAAEVAYAHRSSRFLERFHKLNTALCELISDYSMVSYIPLSIEVHLLLIDTFTVYMC